MPAHLINGFVFTHASTDVQVTDGFARFITKAECMTIGHKEKRDQALKANDMLARGRTLVLESDLPNTTKDKLRREFIKAVVMSFLDRKNDDTKQPIDEIVAKFAEAICEAKGLVQPKLPEQPLDAAPASSSMPTIAIICIPKQVKRRVWGKQLLLIRGLRSVALYRSTRATSSNNGNSRVSIPMVMSNSLVSTMKGK